MVEGDRRRARSPSRNAGFCQGSVLIPLLVAVAVAALLQCLPLASAAAGCDLFRGRWVVDESYPLYDASTCPFVPVQFDCRRNGRPDAGYLKLRWSPDGCRLPRYVVVVDGVERICALLLARSH